MKISPSYAIVLRGNETKRRIEWAFICLRGMQTDHFFTLGLNALIEQELHTENKMAGGMRYSTVRRVLMEKELPGCPDWARLTLPWQRSLKEIQGVKQSAIIMVAAGHSIG